jgi:hypothetical protein
MDNDLLKSKMDIFDNLNHIKSYISKEPKFLCFGNRDNSVCSFFKDCCFEDFVNATVVTMSNRGQLDKALSYFNLVFISDINKEKVLFLIRNVLHIIRPEVFIIDEYTYKHYKLDVVTRPIFEAIHESFDLINQYEYILEATNKQYVLVRRDCYKGF